MSFIKSMQDRYTTKMYDQTQKIDLNKIEELKEILRMSPSSINSQPWKFTFISDPEMKTEFAKASFFNEEKVMNCDTLVVFSRIDNIQLFENQITGSIPEAAIGYYNQFLKPQGEEKIKAWFEKQVYLALGVFLSACAEMKIDSTPMEGIDREKYDSLFDSNDYSSLVAVAIGHRDAEDFNQIEKSPKSRISSKLVINAI